MTPKISVIVPVYNVEKYLPRCIDSILSQTFTDFELLLIDDGSPDNCGKICDEYAAKDSRVKVFHKSNGGVSSARNLGLDNAQGEWITFIDSDDYIEQGFLFIPEIVSEDLLIQDYKHINVGKTKQYEFLPLVISSPQMQCFINENMNKVIFRVPWAKFFKRSIIVDNSLRFLNGVKIGEDTLFVYDYLSFTTSVRYLNRSKYVYVDGCTFERYRDDVHKSTEGLNLMIDRYDKLNANSKTFLKTSFLFYYELIYPKTYKSLKIWRENLTVRRIYNQIYKDLGLVWNVLYWIYPLYRTYKVYVKVKKIFVKVK